MENKTLKLTGVLEKQNGRITAMTDKKIGPFNGYFIVDNLIMMFEQKMGVEKTELPLNDEYGEKSIETIVMKKLKFPKAKMSVKLTESNKVLYSGVSKGDIEILAYDGVLVMQLDTKERIKCGSVDFMEAMLEHPTSRYDISIKFI